MNERTLRNNLDVLWYMDQNEATVLETPFSQKFQILWEVDLPEVSALFKRAVFDTLDRRWEYYFFKPTAIESAEIF